MKKTILITGGAGFVGSSLALLLKQKYSSYSIICLDNLKRRGSELNLPRLKQNGISFVHGDIRNKEDLFQIPAIDFMIECSAEPSVLAGLDGSPDYLINTNLLGTIHCLEYVRQKNASILFLSTSRVYPIEAINSLTTIETDTRFELTQKQSIPGASKLGINENFPLTGARSLYGTTKLASELLIQEYGAMYGIKNIINRCGVIAGPWQMGKIDQGVLVHWIAAHLFDKPLKYFGYGGKGKQVRDILHIEDLFRLIDIQLSKIDELNGEVFNVGGGKKVSVSLNELTGLVQKTLDKTIPIGSITEDRQADIKIYLTDNTKVYKKTGWEPQISAKEIVEQTAHWLKDKKDKLIGILG